MNATRSLASRALAIGAAAVAGFGVFAVAESALASGSRTSPWSRTSPRGAGADSTEVRWAKLVMGTPPQSLDPGLDYTTEGAEVNWLVYTGLLTYRHANGLAGTHLIPGLATSLPVVSDGGRTYTMTLRKGLVFSNGSPVVASDFTYTVERALKIPWGGAGEFITPVIAGAQAYATGKAKTISGITTDDASGRISIHLTAPYGPFDNVLTFPALGLIPAGTPFTAQPTDPPPGVGPYAVTQIKPNQSFSIVKNPYWTRIGIKDIPAGHLDIHVMINSNQAANALEVLDNSADIFDWSDTIPGALVSQVKAKAPGRFRMVDLADATYFVFLNTAERPFSSELAREAVVQGIDLHAIQRLESGDLVPGCFLLPPNVPGHPAGARCPYNRGYNGNLAQARALVRRSGMFGQHVAVWTQARQPFLNVMTYYAHFLSSIGFRASIKVIDSATYFQTIGEERTVHPQTGFGAWVEDFPDPIDFYGVLLNGHAIEPVNNENFGEVNDPSVNSRIARLGPTPSTELGRVTAQWQALDEYVARKAYLAVLGYPTYPEFASSRIDYKAVVFHPLYGWDLTSLRLN